MPLWVEDEPCALPVGVAKTMPDDELRAIFCEAVTNLVGDFGEAWAARRLPFAVARDERGEPRYFDLSRDEMLVLIARHEDLFDPQELRRDRAIA